MSEAHPMDATFHTHGRPRRRRHNFDASARLEGPGFRVGYPNGRFPENGSYVLTGLFWPIDDRFADRHEALVIETRSLMLQRGRRRLRASLGDGLELYSERCNAQ